MKNAILGIIAAVAASRMIDMEGELTVREELLKSHLRYAQYMGLCGDGTSTWRIKISTSSYRFEKITGGTTAGISLPGESYQGESFPDVILPSGITLSTGQAGGNIDFDEWGSPGSSDVRVIIAAGTAARTVTITGNTGFIP